MNVACVLQVYTKMSMRVKTIDHKMEGGGAPTAYLNDINVNSFFSFLLLDQGVVNERSLQISEI